jgi:hypothetical protein
MYAKVFTQILDSSIAEHWQTRLVFEDFLKLCDLNGVVDMTRDAIARRTNVPLEIVKQGISELEKPDPHSRNPENEGRRIVRLDEHRDWGWLICNYEHYRNLVTEEQRREKTRVRVKNFRDRRAQPGHDTQISSNASVTLCNAPATPVTMNNASNAMQRERERQMDKTCSTKARKLSPAEKELADTVERILGDEWINDAGKWLNRITGGIGTDGKLVPAEPGKVRRVFSDLERAIKDDEVTKTRAGYAQYMWEQFK